MHPLRSLSRRLRRAVPRRGLHAAVAQMADLLELIDGGDVFTGFRCAEIDSIAAVLVHAGEHHAASHVITRHAEHDEHDSGDRHAHLRDLIDQHGRHAPPVADAAIRYTTALIPA